MSEPTFCDLTSVMKYGLAMSDSDGAIDALDVAAVEAHAIG